MSKVGRWSPTAGNNNSSPPDGWPEGQLPSTVNDCAREMMAQIRTLISDAQFIDQDLTPTYITATSFSVPGDQTSAIHAGRRLKLFDATAGVPQVIFATVETATFTAVTTINLSNDNSGSLTSSLSSFGIGIVSRNNNAFPRYMDITASSMAVLGSLSISGTCVAANFVGGGALFAWAHFGGSTSGVVTPITFNCVASRSAVGVYRVSFNTDTLTPYYGYIIQVALSAGGASTMYMPHELVKSTTSLKFQTDNGLGAADFMSVNVLVFR